VGVSLFYTSGFHPKPDMTFSPALSLGVASLAEILDAELTRSSPEGLVWKAGALLGPDDKGVAKAINGARYAVGIPRRALDALGGETRLFAEAQRVESASEIRLVRRFERGLAKAVDVKRFLRALSPCERAADFLDAARVAGDLVPLLVDVDVTLEGGVKIAEVMEALFGKNDAGEVAVPYHAVRAELGLWNEQQIISPIELETVSSARRRRAVRPSAAHRQSGRWSTVGSSASRPTKQSPSRPSTP